MTSLRMPSGPLASGPRSSRAAYSCRTFWMSCTMVSNRSSLHLRIHANALLSSASSSRSACRSRASRSACTCSGARGRYHSPLSSAAAVMMSCSTRLLSVSCCSVLRTMASTRTITLLATDCRRSFSSAVAAVSFLVATLNQNLASTAKMFSATTWAICCWVFAARRRSIRSSSAAVSMSDRAGSLSCPVERTRSRSPHRGRG
mmetsp:Transcript_35936/g.79995  ORF Transcript_35936/g.79995 Transcript_35936/m.79995 type:complete len:203 (-) Transcript_35936:223-831(-)